MSIANSLVPGQSKDTKELEQNTATKTYTPKRLWLNFFCLSFCFFWWQQSTTFNFLLLFWFFQHCLSWWIPVEFWWSWWLRKKVDLFCPSFIFLCPLRVLLTINKTRLTKGKKRFVHSVVNPLATKEIVISLIQLNVFTFWNALIFVIF